MKKQCISFLSKKNNTFILQGINNFNSIECSLLYECSEQQHEKLAHFSLKLSFFPSILFYRQKNVFIVGKLKYLTVVRDKQRQSP